MRGCPTLPPLLKSLACKWKKVFVRLAGATILHRPNKSI